MPGSWRLATGDAEGVRVTALYTLGRLAESTDRVVDAEAAYKAVIAIRPDHKPSVAALETLSIVRQPRDQLRAAAEKVLDGQILEDDDVASLSRAELRVLRNAPYARQGLDFGDPGLNWFYYGALKRRIDPEYRARKLTIEDRANVKFFRVVSDKLKQQERAGVSGDLDDPFQK